MNFLNFWRRKEANHRIQDVSFEQILQKVATAIKNFKSEGALEKKPTLKLKILSNQASLAQQLAEKLVDNAGTATYGKTEVGHYAIDCTYPDIDLQEVSIKECLNQVHQMAIEHESILQDCELV